MQILIGDTYRHFDDDLVLKGAINACAIKYNVSKSAMTDIVEDFGLEQEICERFVSNLEKFYNDN